MNRLARAPLFLLLGGITLAAFSLTFTHLAGSAGGPGSDDSDTAVLARFSSNAGIAVDASGNIYVADTANHTIRKIFASTGAVTTFAGLAESSGFANGRGAHARFNGPRALVVDSSGNVFVSDTGTNTIRKITPAGVASYIVGYPGMLGFNDGSGFDARFSTPRGITIDGSGNLYVADTFNHAIRKVAPNGAVTTLAGTGIPGNANGTGTAASFNQPTGIVYNATTGSLFVADSINRVIRQVTLQGVVTTFAGTMGSAQHGNGIPGSFYLPTGICAAADGTLYVADSFDHTLRSITTGGTVGTIAGDATYPGPGDGIGTAARFRSPEGVAVSGGNLYVADTGNHTVRKVALTSSNSVTTQAGASNVAGFVNASGDQARFDAPAGLAYYPGIAVFVADTNNHAIRRINSAGVATTFAGGTYGYLNGNGTSAQFRNPRGLALRYSDFALLVADSANHCIRMVAANGDVTLYAGQPTSAGADNGNRLTAARFSSPGALALGVTGNLFVTDVGNRLIRKIAASDGTVSTLASFPPFVSYTGITVDSSDNVYATKTDGVIVKITPAGIVSNFAGACCDEFPFDGIGYSARFVYPGPTAISGDPYSSTAFVADPFARLLRTLNISSASVGTAGGKAIVSGTAPGTGAFARFYNLLALSAFSSQDVAIADGNTIRVAGRELADRATIDSYVGRVGNVRQLDTYPTTATSWSWSLIRRPAGSTATLSSTTIRNPTFTPDVNDLYVFRCVATGSSGRSISTVSLQGNGPATTFTIGYPGPTTTGVATPLFVIALDADGNRADGYTGTVHFTTSDVSATVPADTTFTSGDHGLRTVGFTFRTAGYQSITATDTVNSGVVGTTYFFVGSPCTAQAFSVPGAVSASLTTGSCTTGPRGPGYYADLYAFQGTAGSTVTINLSSQTLDSYLYLRSPAGTTVALDDDSAGNLNSRIVYTLGSTGTWEIQATTFGPNATGAYQLSACVQTPISIPGTVASTLTTSSCTNSPRGANFYGDVYVFSGQAGSAVTIDQTSSTFDSFLYLLRPDGTVAASDDDGGGTLNSRIRYTLDQSGSWYLHATTYSPSSTGSYQLAIANSANASVTVTVNGVSGPDLSKLSLYAGSFDIDDAANPSNPYTFTNPNLTPGNPYRVDAFATDMLVGNTGSFVAATGNNAKTITAVAQGSVLATAYYANGTTIRPGVTLSLVSQTGRTWRTCVTASDGRCQLAAYPNSSPGETWSLRAPNGSPVSVTLTAGGSTARSVVTSDAPPATQPPVISSVSPGASPTSGGTSVVITGQNLNGVTAVTFGGVPGTITASSATSITVTAPAHAAESSMFRADRNITVFNGDGQQKISVTGARDGRGFQIPDGDYRFGFTISTTALSSLALTATGGPGRIDLQWTPFVANGAAIAGYNVYRSTTSGGPYILVNPSTFISDAVFSDQSVTPGVRYYYIWRAISADLEEGPDSSEASAIGNPLLKGDANGDGVLNVNDPVRIGQYLYASGPPPVQSVDVNGDHVVNALDIFYLHNYLFGGGPAPTEWSTSTIASADFDGEILVKLRDKNAPPGGPATPGMSAIAREFNIRSVQPLFKGGKLSDEMRKWRRVRFSDTRGADTLAKRYRAMTDVEEAETNHRYRLGAVPNDPKYADQWSLAAVHASEAWAITQGSPSQVIAIIDTGIDFEHPDLASKMWTSGGARGWNFLADNDNIADDNGHGTHCAGIAAAATNNGTGIAGACPQCRLMAVKAFDANGNGNAADIARAINYAASNGATVISMSFADDTESAAIKDALVQAKSTALLIAAAGNDKKSRATPLCAANGQLYEVKASYPAAYPFVLGVEASDPGGGIASYSNCGYPVRVGGTTVPSTLPNNSYGGKTGTSMAAPLVAGVAGLLRAQKAGDPAWTVDALFAQLQQAGGDAFQALTLGPRARTRSATVSVTDAPDAFCPTCNADGAIQPGETVKVVVTIHNDGSAQAGSVTGVLSTSNAHATVSNGSFTFGAIGPNADRDNASSPFRITVAADAGASEIISLSLAVTVSGDTQAGFTQAIPITVTRSVPKSGVISSNETWTRDKVWMIAGNVRIDSTVTIESGTTVQFAPGTSIVVRGRLDAIGDATRRIVIQGGGSGGITFEATGSSVVYCTIDGGATGTTAEAFALTLKQTYFANNIVTNTGALTTGGSTIEYNLFTRSIGPALNTNTDSVIRLNTIVNNQTGAFLNTLPSDFSSNVIFGNTLYNLEAGSSDVTLGSNFWGTTETPVIQQTINDFAKKSSKGVVTVQPILSDPPNTAPPVVKGITLNPASPVGAVHATFTVTFSRPMSTAVLPRIAFGPTPPHSKTTVFSNGQWVGGVDVVVTTPGGTATAASAFTYQP